MNNNSDNINNLGHFVHACMFQNKIHLHCKEIFGKLLKKGINKKCANDPDMTSQKFVQSGLFREYVLSSKKAKIKCAECFEQLIKLYDDDSYCKIDNDYLSGIGVTLFLAVERIYEEIYGEFDNKVANNDDSEFMAELAKIYFLDGPKQQCPILNKDSDFGKQLYAQADNDSVFEFMQLLLTFTYSTFDCNTEAMSSKSHWLLNFTHQWDHSRPRLFEKWIRNGYGSMNEMIKQSLVNKHSV